MRALVLADDGRLSRHIVFALQEMGFALDHVASVDGGLEALTHSGGDYDLAVADLDFAGSAVLDFSRALKSSSPAAHAMIMATPGDFENIKVAIESGADDFILKPVNLDELKVRVISLLARTNQSEVATVEYGPLVVDMATRQAWLDGKQMELTPRERGVLLTLLRQRGKPVSKQHIASRLFTINDEVAPTAVEIYVHRLRRKLEHESLVIKTERGLGYALHVHESDDSDKG